MTDNTQDTIPYIISDVDGTLIRWQLFHRLVEELVAQGLLPRIVTTRIQESLNRYKDREAPFKEFVDTAVAAYQADGRLRGIRMDDLKLVARELIKKEGKRVHVFTRELLAVGKRNGFNTAFISGSPAQVVEELARFYGVDIWLGTEHPHENGVFTGGQAKEWVTDKKAAIRHLQAEHGIRLNESVAIGDSESDIPMLEMVRWPIVFNPNAGLYHAACTHHWPVVVEKKLVYMETFGSKDGRGIRCNAWPDEILPLKLAQQLTLRLEDLGVGAS